MIYDDIKIKEIDGIKFRVEKHSKTIEEIIDETIEPYCKNLDKYVAFISECLKDGQNPPTDYELEDFVLNLSTNIYWSGGSVEQLGIRDDISKAIYKEVYHSSRASLEKGTVADKDSLAELESQQELLTNICYARAYKIMKSKIENAQEILSSCKKVLTKRISDVELARTGGK